MKKLKKLMKKFKKLFSKNNNCKKIMHKSSKRIRKIMIKIK